MVLAHNINEGQRTQDVQIKEDISFESILLANNTLSGLKKAGFYKPSPIQLHGIPLGKCGFDLLLEAKSGTGKTAVFTVIALEKIDLQKGLQVIMLAPTREIAAQICHVIKEIGSDYTGLKVEVVMGGLPVQEDVLKFKSKLVHIVVGSPGRLKHLILDKHIDVSAVRLLVLDECDKLVEKSFLTDINAIFSILPKQKQVIMSSATYPEKCKTFISKYVHNAQHICPDSTTVLLGITQKVTIVKYNNNIVKQTQNRFEELLKIMATKQFKQCLIFCNYQARVTELHKMLTREKWPAELLYGQQEQNDRLDALRTLQEYKCRILISTDLAARGIDASNVDLIINFEPPFEWQTYLHRIGRAGRYGSYGTAITILSEGKEVTKFQDLFESINLSLNLRNLWTDDEFSNSIQNNSSETSVIHKTNYIPPEKEIISDEMTEELWNIFTGENEKDTKVLQTFEELQKSHQMICSSHNNNIENFNDLLSSFKQSGDAGKENVEYAHINVRPIPIKKYLKCFQSDNIIEETESINQSIMIDTLSVKSKEEQNQNPDALSIQYFKHMDDKSDYKNPSNIKKHKTNNSQYNEGTNFLYINENNCDHSPGNAKALLEAGLPTSFGRTNNPGNKFYSYSKRFVGKINNKKEEMLGNEHLDTVGDKLQPQHERNIVFSSNHKNYHNCNSFSKKSPLCRNLMGNHHSTYSPAKPSNFEKCNYNYEIWYKQLKMNVKYIEHIIYNDEMSYF